MEGIIQKFSRGCQFCNGDLNRFVLLLREGVYPHEDSITGKNEMKPHYHLKTIFIAN